MTRPVIKLPFPGFYNSQYSEAIDHCVEQFCANSAKLEREKWAPELQLSADEFAEMLWDCCDYSAACHYVAREYVASFGLRVSDALGFPLHLQFEAVKSPREYNFETDRVFAFTTWKAVKQLFKMSKADNHEHLALIIRERFTSCSGFISFYTTDLHAWLRKPIRNWDHNERETLLLACMELAGRDRRNTDDVLAHMIDSNDFDRAFSDMTDWEKLDAKISDLRADKLADLKAKDPSYVPPPERCPLTLDLFHTKSRTPAQSGAHLHCRKQRKESDT